MTRLIVLALLVALLWSGMASAAGNRPDPPVVFLPLVATDVPPQVNEATPAPAQDRMAPIGERMILVYEEQVGDDVWRYILDEARGLCFASYAGGLVLVPGEECW